MLSIFNLALAAASAVMGVFGVIAFIRTWRRGAPRMSYEVQAVRLIYNRRHRAEFILLKIMAYNGSDTGNALTDCALLYGAAYMFHEPPAAQEAAPNGDTTFQTLPSSRFGPRRLLQRGLRVEWLNLPANIPPHTSLSGWVAFATPRLSPPRIHELPMTLSVASAEGAQQDIDAPLPKMTWWAELPPAMPRHGASSTRQRGASS